MRETRLTLPELALIAGTRAAAGAGLGFLLSNRLSESQRRAVGWTLLTVGVLSTVPLVFEVFGHSRKLPPEEVEAIGKTPFPEANEPSERPSALART
jgi:hypothetical protein